MALLQRYIIIDLEDIEDMAPSSGDELKSLIDILFVTVNVQTEFLLFNNWSTYIEMPAIYADHLWNIICSVRYRLLSNKSSMHG